MHNGRLNYGFLFAKSKKHLRLFACVMHEKLVLKRIFLVIPAFF